MTTATADGVPRVFLVETDYERALVEADLVFTRRLADDIESAALDGVEHWRSFHTSEGEASAGEKGATP